MDRLPTQPMDKVNLAVTRHLLDGVLQLEGCGFVTGNSMA